MAHSLRRPSLWDSIPSETVLDICSFLSTIDLLNLCAAYHEIEELAIGTSTLWRTVHLPYPDPQLYNYPGWRRLPPAVLRSTFHSPRHVRQPNNTITIFQDARYRFLASDGDNDLHDLEEMGIGGAQSNFIAWIILDVLAFIPLHFTRHLSFDSPPCHLCVYPCRRFCACECHQNEQSHHQQDSAYQFQHYLNAWNPSQQVELAPISQPLQNLFESGLVDFSRHINVHSLNQALTMPTSSNTATEIRYTGISHLSFISQPINNNTANVVHDELSLGDALQQLSSIEDEQPALEEQSQHAPSWLHYPETPAQTHGTYVTDAVGLETSLESRHQLSEEEHLEELRQQSETRAAYLRARLLIQILSLGGLESLETLRAPWWPAARIYAIRQQLERWSYMVEQALTTAHNDGAVADPLRPTPIDAPRQRPTLSLRIRWTNRLLSDVYSSTSLAPGLPAVHSSPEPEAPAVEGQLQVPEVATPTPSFPLASLTRFTLRCGGELSSHDRHCLGMSAMILSGRSSANSSQAGTPPPPPVLDLRMSIPSEGAPTSSITTHSPCKGVFRYCHQCGSQYLQASTTASNTLDRACFCRIGTSMQK